MFEKAFPIELRNDVYVVCQKCLSKTLHIKQSEQQSYWTLPDYQVIQFPYRIYYLDENEDIEKDLTDTQQIIYHCLFSRSSDGFVREKHIHSLLSLDLPIWAIPYILKVCDEYVVEILEFIYLVLKDQDTIKYKQIIDNNLSQFIYGYHRMISYWNEFYRNRCYSYHEYVGYKLYKECFGYTRSMEKVKKQLQDITTQIKK